MCVYVKYTQRQMELEQQREEREKMSVESSETDSQSQDSPDNGGDGGPSSSYSSSSSSFDPPPPPTLFSPELPDSPPPEEGNSQRPYWDTDMSEEAHQAAMQIYSKQEGRVQQTYLIPLSESLATLPTLATPTVNIFNTTYDEALEWHSRFFSSLFSFVDCVLLSIPPINTLLFVYLLNVFEILLFYAVY